MFVWKRLGQVFNPTVSSQYEWMQEQAQNPFAVEMKDFVRVYFNTRPKRDVTGKSTSFPGFVDLQKSNLLNVINISSKPVLSLGSVGTFDEFGVMAGAVFPVKDEYYLYYCGWTRMLSVPYNWAIGLATSLDKGTTFSRIGSGPVIGSTPKEPFLQAGCTSILRIGERELFHLWYTSGVKWIKNGSKAESVYQIMHAVSDDGINWRREGNPIVQPILEDEAQASPSVFRMNGIWHMVFSYRYSTDFRNSDRGYRLGYAYSNDLHKWTRDDRRLGFDVSESGWDSEMVCYPHVKNIADRWFLFYCGNDFGKEGFGLAELIEWRPE